MSVSFFFFHCCCFCCVFRISLAFGFCFCLSIIWHAIEMLCASSWCVTLLWRVTFVELKYANVEIICIDIYRPIHRLNGELRVLNWLHAVIIVAADQFIKIMYPSNEFRTTITLILLEQIYCTITSRCSMKILDPS